MELMYPDFIAKMERWSILDEQLDLSILLSISVAITMLEYGLDRLPTHLWPSVSV